MMLVFFCFSFERAGIGEDLAAEEKRYSEVFVVRLEMGGKHILEDK